MQTRLNTGILGLALALTLLTLARSTQGAITSDFNDGIYPGTAGDGWVDGWTNNIGSPEVRTNNAIDGETPYVYLNATGGTIRNFMRRFESGAGVDITGPYYIRWKFRLDEANFDTAFAATADRVHFFGRDGPRVTASTDASINWMLYAAGAATGDIIGGKTFWYYDNETGSSSFTSPNVKDTGVPLVPFHTYAFEVLVIPDQRSYTLSVIDETAGNVSFKSSAPHRFRNLTAAGDAFTYVHFGTQASSSSEVRPFGLDSVSISPWGGPSIANVSPMPYAVHAATNGVQFEVVALDPVAAGDIGLTLNGLDVTAQLNVGGTETQRTVSFSGLSPDVVYDMVITATNASGVASVSRTFYTATGPFTLYDSEGFTSDVLYPLGYLQAVTHGDAVWIPAAEPAELVDVGAPYGKVLQQLNTGASHGDVVQFPPVSSGTMVMEFDAIASTMLGRTIDLALMTANGEWASHMAWGALSEKLAYYHTASAAWLPVADLPTDWHHCKIVHYLSGPAAGRFDFLLNGTPVAERLEWRNAVPGTPFSRVSYQSHSSGPALEYGRLDNLVITAAPEDPNAFPPPVITNVAPPRYAVVRPGGQLTFEVTSVLPISASDVTVVLNGSNVSSGLTVTGGANHLMVSYGPLEAGQQTAEITANNAVGPVTVNHSFVVADAPLVIFDSGGFTSDELYPLGYLTTNEHNGSRWVPALDPNSGEIADLFDGQYGKVLRRMQLGASYHDYLLFPPVASGVVEIEFDARVSSLDGRTLDLSLNAVTANGGGTQGPFIMWNADLNYYNGSAWVPQMSMDTSWHHLKLICYVSGVLAGTFDLEVDGAPLGTGLVWRTLVSPVGTLRIGSLNSGAVVGGYGEVDNLVLRAAPEPIVALPVTLLHPRQDGGTFSFTFPSLPGISYLAEYNGDLGRTNWTTLETVTGDGVEKTVVHTNPPAGPLFYRIQSQLP